LKKEQFLWVEKYRPKTLEDYVFKDDNVKKTVEQWIHSKDIPHILLYGPPGTGKSALINILKQDLGLEDILEINASNETSIDVIRTKVMNFIQTMSFQPYKVVILEEAEMISPNGQAALKRPMEEYASSVRFILTSNNVNRIDPAIRSRLQAIHIDRQDELSFKIRAVQILAEEGVNFTEETLDAYMRASYPDMRKMINSLQLNCVDGVLLSSTSSDVSTSDYQLQAVELFKANKIQEARKLICANIKQEEYEEFYRFLYRNLDLFAADETKQNEALIIINQGLLDNTITADSEINLSATLVKLGML